MARRSRKPEIRDSSDHQWLIWSTYFIGDQPVLNGRKAQLLYGVRSFLGAPVSAALAGEQRLAESDCKSARATLDEFFGAMGRPVRATLHRPTAARSSGESALEASPVEISRSLH